MKSLILGFFLMSVSIGNLFTAGVNHFIQNRPRPRLRRMWRAPTSCGVQRWKMDKRARDGHRVGSSVGPKVEEKGFLKKNVGRA